MRIKYPEYKVNEDTAGTTREIKQRKQDALEAVKTSLSADSSIFGCEDYFTPM